MVNEKKNLMVFGYGLMLIAAFLAVGSIIHHGPGLTGGVFSACAAVFGLTTFFHRDALRPGYAGWMKAAHLVGMVVTTVILAGLFFLVFTPVACVLRLLKKDHLDRKIDRAARSYWSPRQTEADPRARLEQQF